VKILFYLEPHVIRGNSKEYSWIAKSLITPIEELSKLKNISLWIFSNPDVNADLTAKIRQENSRYLTFQGAALRTYKSLISNDWSAQEINKWREVYRDTGPISGFYRDQIKNIFIKHDIDAIVTWGNSAICRNFCRQHGLFYTALELGPLRPPLMNSIIADYEGVNGEASSSVIKSNEVVEQHSISFLDNNFFDTQEFLLSSNITSSEIQGQYVLIALQLEDDSNTLFHSNFASTIDMLNHLIRSQVLSKYKLVFKLHPKARNNIYNEQKTLDIVNFIEEHFTDYVLIKEDSNRSTLTLAMHAKWIIVNNSSVGFEAALMGKPVSTLSEQHYGGSQHYPKISEINTWKPNHQSSYVDRINKIYAYLIENNLYNRAFAFSSSGLLHVILHQARRYQNSEAPKLRKTLGACLLTMERNKSVDRDKTISYHYSRIGKHKLDNFILIRKIRTAIWLISVNPRLFLHELMRKFFKK
jgi:hypothetical protein